MVNLLINIIIICCSILLLLNGNLLINDEYGPIRPTPGKTIKTLSQITLLLFIGRDDHYSVTIWSKNTDNVPHQTSHQTQIHLLRSSCARFKHFRIELEKQAAMNACER